MRTVLERAMGRASSTLSPGHRHFAAEVNLPLGTYSHRDSAKYSTTADWKLPYDFNHQGQSIGYFLVDNLEPYASYLFAKEGVTLP